MAVTLLTIAEYARHRGCDEKAVRKALAEERITRQAVGKRCIDPAIADQQWQNNTRARADSGRRQRPAAPGAAGGEAPPPGAGAQGQRGDDYWAMRDRRERAEALMAEIELEKASKKVLDREPALRAIFTKFRELRDGGMVLGRRLAPVLAPMTDPNEIRIAIDRAQASLFDSFVRRSLQSLVDGLAGAPVPVPDDVRQAPADQASDEGTAQ